MSQAQIHYPGLQPLAGDMKPDAIIANVKAHSAMNLQSVFSAVNENGAIEVNGQVFDSNSTVAIVNPGPSAGDKDVIKFLNTKVDGEGNPMLIVLAGNGHSMLRRGLEKADISFHSHPNNIMTVIPDFGKRDDIEYWMSTMSPSGYTEGQPPITDYLREKDEAGNLGHFNRTVRAYNAHVQGVSEFKDEPSVGVSSGAPLSAMAVLSALGMRKFRVCGMDVSSAYNVKLNKDDEVNRRLDALDKKKCIVQSRDEEGYLKRFECATGLLPQLEEMVQFVERYPGKVDSLEFTGDTITACVFNKCDGAPRPYQVLEMS